MANSSSEIPHGESGQASGTEGNHECKVARVRDANEQNVSDHEGEERKATGSRKKTRSG